jgi:hypothetical protein
MQTSKNNLLQAQLTLCYELYKEKLPVTNSKQASELFLQFAKSINNIDGWYIILLDKKKRFMCWHNLENFCDIPVNCHDIACFAKILKAKHIIMARLESGKNSRIGYLDICWIAEMLKYCEQKCIIFDDYLVITEKGWCSYDERLAIE